MVVCPVLGLHQRPWSLAGCFPLLADLSSAPCHGCLSCVRTSSTPLVPGWDFINAPGPWLGVSLCLLICPLLSVMVVCPVLGLHQRPWSLAGCFPLLADLSSALCHGRRPAAVQKFRHLGAPYPSGLLTSGS
ncbi:hypothetical protein RRG08_050927 [Elysia crispata]|uniref:Uncharacterized protein n=1 Tax=Elysia crispata TaxID=231223 RepID=A0AAE0YR33_9GAST|nr:hypothetical protein RRG08_050927 [Elysia crispata]